MYWSIESFPELEHLSAEERRELLRQALPPGWNSRIMGSSAAGGLFLGIIVSGTLMSQLSLVYAALAFCMFSMISAAAIYQVRLICIRGQLLIYLERVAKQRALPMCLKCGYDMTGQMGARCPECGWTPPTGRAEWWTLTGNPTPQIPEKANRLQSR